MSAPFTPEQEARVRQIVGEALVGVERERAARRMAALNSDIDYGITALWDHPSEALDQAEHPAEEGTS